jgi:hypothetical protein
LVREIREELGAQIAVESYLTTIDYDYPAFHLHMGCYLCRVTEGELTLKEHEAARWLSRDELDAVAWLPADRTIIELLKKELREHHESTRRMEGDRLMSYEIVPLPKEKWKGTVIPIRYTTEEYFDVELTETGDAFQARMLKKRFDAPVTHGPEAYDFPDRLYQDHWEKAEAWGVLSEAGELLACIELCPEEWSNRLMVTELWVTDRLHRRGLGTRLMDLAKEKAREQGRRAIILETQSCNVRAIAFYRSQGFRLIGFDACCYANNDIARHEVRFNFGYFLNSHP